MSANVQESPRFALSLCQKKPNFARTSPMKTELTPENAAIITKYTQLTGFTKEELANWFLADYFQTFDDEGYVEQTNRLHDV